MAEDSSNGARRSFTSTGFLTFLTSWAGSLVTMLSNTDAVVRHWGAAGMVCLPALYLLCSTLIKRAKLRAPRPALPSLGSALALAKAVAAPPDPGKP
jgi:hypothetical protein